MFVNLRVQHVFIDVSCEKPTLVVFFVTDLATLAWSTENPAAPYKAAADTLHCSGLDLLLALPAVPPSSAALSPLIRRLPCFKIKPKS